MKKIIAILLTAFMLCACGDSAPKSVSKACTYSEGGISATFTATAKGEDADIEKIDFNIDMTYEAMQVSKDDLSDEMKELMAQIFEQSILESFAEEFGNTDGIEVKTNFTDEGLSFAFTMDSKAFDGESIKLQEFVDEFSGDGYTCK